MAKNERVSTVSGAGMANSTYIIAAILLIGWAVGFFGFHVGNEIHLLLAIAMIAVLVNIIRGG